MNATTTNANQSDVLLAAFADAELMLVRNPSDAVAFDHLIELEAAWRGTRPGTAVPWDPELGSRQLFLSLLVGAISSELALAPAALAEPLAIEPYQPEVLGTLFFEDPGRSSAAADDGL